MSGYYYLGAQLPLLFFDREAAMSIDYFLAEARKWLSAADLDSLAAVDLNRFEPVTGIPGLLKTYIEFEKNIRTDIEAYRRSIRAGQDYKPQHFPAATIKEGNPLEIERKLLRLRWDFICDLELGHYFDIEFILLYYLKLQILRRLFTFNKETGVQAFKKLCEVEV